MSAQPHTPAHNDAVDAFGQHLARRLKTQSAPLNTAQMQALDQARQRALAAHASRSLEAAPVLSTAGARGSFNTGDGAKTHWLYWALPALLVLAALLWLQGQNRSTQHEAWPQSLAQLDTNTVAAFDELDLLDDDIPLAAYTDAGFLQYLEQAAAQTATAPAGAAS